MNQTVSKVACVEIGGVAISVSTTHSGFYELLRNRYEGFVSSARPEFHLDFEIVETGASSDDDVCVRRDGGEWQIRRGDFLARWNPETGIGLVRQNANPYSLDSVLRILHSLVLAERGGFLLHAASAIFEGAAYLFSGVSGAGKTTMTRLAPSDVTLLTDEISYVRLGNPQGLGPRLNVGPREGAERGSLLYRAFGTPFSGELGIPGENTAAEIGGLFFLEKGLENRVDEITPAEAVRRLMRNILFFADDPDLGEMILSSACDFVDRVPIRLLTFYPDARVWDEIRHFKGMPAHV